jgi:hypothetical protein
MLRHDSGRSGYNADVGSFRPPLALLDKIQLLDQTADGHQIFDVVAGPERIYAMGQFVIWGVNKEDPST